MTKLAWKTINGYGPYAYLQESVRTGGTVVSKHVAYLGKLGLAAFPGHHVSWSGLRILAPSVPKDIKALLKPSAAANVTAVEGQLAQGVAPKYIKVAKKGKAFKDPAAGAAVSQETPTLPPSKPTKGKTTPTVGSASPPSHAPVKGKADTTSSGVTALASQIAPTKTPKLGIPALDNNGKPLIKAANVKKLEAVASSGDIAALEALGAELSEKMLAESKKAAIANAVVDLKGQMQGQVPLEGHSGSSIADIIEEVDQGERKLPKQTIPSSSTVQVEIEKASLGKKDWDADLVKVSGKKGSNEGGLYKDSKLQTFHYAKWPGDDRARVEVLANRLYREAGVPTPNAAIIELIGQTAVLSDWVDDVAPMTFAQMAKHNDVRRNFVVDAWLANWDVVGASSDNIVKGPGGVAYRIDTGGSIVYRAQGKPKAFSATEVLELESMRNPISAPQAAKVFAGLTHAELQAGAKAVASVSDPQIDEAVDATSPNAATAIKMALKGRRDFIIKNVLNAKQPKPVTLAKLSSLGSLSTGSIKLLQERHPDLLPAKHSTLRSATAKSIATKELGSAKKAQPAVSAVRTNYSEWKSSTLTTGGTMIRWGAATLEDGQQGGEEEIKALEAFWSFKAGGSKQQANQAFQDRRLAEGDALVEGLGVNRDANAVLMALQHGGQDEVVLYRTWQPDQVKFFGWKSAKVGDLINMPAEVYSHTLNPGVFAHGGLRTKVKVPVRKMLLTDRLNNPGGKFVSEDEVLFRAPITMEVIHV